MTNDARYRRESELKLRSKAIAAGGLALILTGTFAGAAKASSSAHASNDPPVTTADGATSAFVAEVGQDFLDNQRILGQLKSWILAQPGVASSGYIDQVNDAKNLATRLLWHGDDPLKAAALERAKVLGITATVEQRPQSLADINAASKKISDSADIFAASGFTLSSVVGVQADTSTIQVEGEFAGARSSKAAAVSASDLGDRLSNLAGVPVSVVAGKSTTPMAGTRSNDTSPFYAGGYMRSGDKGCSSGFALKIGGVPRTTTARHCKPPSGSWSARSGTADYGNVIATSNDGALNVLSGSGASRTFDNEWDNAAGFSKNVYNIYDVGLNDRVCSSGGNSGVHCNINVSAMAVFWNDGDGSFSNIRGEQQTSGKIAVASGDSGGPVFVPYGGSYSQSVGAVGVIQAGGQSVPCGSVHDATNAECSQTILFSSIHTVILYGGLGASLVTGPMQ